MVITPKPSWSNELVSMLSLLEFITPLDATLLMERNLICFPSQLLKGKAQNQTHMSVVPYPGATRNYSQTYSRHTYISSSNETDWSFPCFLLSHVVAHHAFTQMHDPCKSEEGSVRQLVHFTQPLERIWVLNSFKPLNRTWWLLISKSQIWQLKIFSFFIKWSASSHLTGMGTIFETVKCSLGNITLAWKDIYSTICTVCSKFTFSVNKIKI